MLDEIGTVEGFPRGWRDEQGKGEYRLVHRCDAGFCDRSALLEALPVFTGAHSLVGQQDKEEGIVPPTSKNQNIIDSDLFHFVSENLDLPDDELQWNCEQTVRN